LDRRTDRPDGSGGGSPTVVTSRATGDDLIGDEQDVRPSDVFAPARRSPQMPTAAKSAPAKSAPPDNAASDGTPGAAPAANGAPAAGNGIGASANGKDAARPAATDATIADGVPALPADTIGAARGTKPKGPAPDGETPASKAGEQALLDDSPASSFGPLPSAPATANADPTESAAKPSGDDAWPTAPSRPAPLGPTASGTAPSGRPSSSVPPAPAEPPAVSPAAFAWEMPDPPPNSPSSPARTFLRSGTTGRGSAEPKAASSASPGMTSPGKTEAGKTEAGKAAAGKAAAGKAAAGEGPVTIRKTSRKGQSKRTARQAHLTVARVEPWSVMKFSFVVSLVAFVILFVAVMVLYSVLSGLGVFDSLQRVVTSVTSSQGSAGVNAKAWFSESKVLGYTALLGSLNVVLITAMSTIGSVLYNLTSRLVGGVEVTLRETE
jgi:hypothetical protein